MLKKLAKLIDVKSIVTFVLTGVFSYLSLAGKISTEQFMPIFTMVISFYFGTQVGKKEKEEEIKEEFDCSGLFMDYAIKHNIFKHDLTADGIYRAIPDKIKVSKAKKGDFLFHGTAEKKTHIGYVIDSEWAIEARGTAYGVVKTGIKERGWQFAARPDFWSEKEGPVLRRELYYKNPMMHGDDVGLLQTKINGLDYNCGTADGYFGKKTEMAVKNFQSDQGLTVDGVVGKKTGEALGFIWEG